MIYPITDAQWGKLREGWWVRIAPEEYINQRLDRDDRYLGINYSVTRKKATFGTWQRVVKKHQSKPSVGVCDTFSIHRDFLTDISETEPFTGDTWISPDIYESIPCHQAKVGDEIFVREVWKEILEIIVTPDKQYRAPGEGRVHAKVDNGSISYNLDRSGYKVRRKISSNTKSENKQEKIMLNTAQEIKDAQLEAENVKAGAKAAKAIIDKAQADEVANRLIGLNQTKTSLLRDKAAIEKKIAEVDEMMGLLGYPPAE